MRFGHNFHRYLVSEWHREYVDYNLLKDLAKSPSNVDKVYEELQAGHQKALSFFRWRFGIWQSKVTEFCNMFGIDLTRPIPDAEKVCPFELTLIVDTIYEFQEDLHKLLLFSRVNMDAVDRIIQKLERRGHAENPAHRRTVDDWRRLQTERVTEASRSYYSVETMILNTENALSADLRRTKGKSLYLQRALNPRPWSKQFTRRICQSVQKGDFQFVVEAIASKSSMPIVSVKQLQSLAGDLFRYAVMFWPEQAKAFLFLEPSPEQFLIDYQILKWGIFTMGARARRPGFHRKDHSPIQTQHLRNLVDACTARRSEVLLTKDEFGRLPAHYAAMYNLSWASGDASNRDCSWLFLLPVLDAVETKKDEDLTTTGARFNDIDGLTPLDIAVIHDDYTSLGQLETLADLDRHLPRFVSEEAAGRNMPIALMGQGSRFCSKTLAHRLGGVAGLRRLGCVGEFVQAAAQVGCMEAIGYLVGEDVPMDQESRTALTKSEDNGWADSRGWTPLFHACAQGHYDVVKYLLSFENLGSQTGTDHLGWTAKEYAVLNGHLAVAALFEPSSLCDMMDGPGRMPADKITNPTVHCPKGERIIIASLGSERLHGEVTGVDLFCCSSDHNPNTLGGLRYALEVSAPGTTGGPQVVRMPILDDQINCPFVFSVPAGVEPELIFRITNVDAKAGNEEFLCGIGVALPEGNTRQFGPGRRSLIREQTIPIINHRGETCDGTVTFTYMVVNHFPHLHAPRDVDPVRKPTEPPLLVGHRGLGMNLKTHEYLQIGENTVESFLSAAKLGASFVEFDVQVTKDHEAVIFHDFSLSESGTDVPIHDLTLDQFMYASNIQSPHGNPLSVLGPTHARDQPGEKRGRSRSVGGHFEAGAIQVRDRMKHTVDFKLKGYKPNTRGDFVQDSFATLKELLAKVPEDVGFDIEIKYPRLHEATAANVAPVAIDLNTFVDTALLALHEHATPNRRIMLSSFTPEICILLSIKQKAFPVFFITNAGKVPMLDMERRAASVQVAVRFAQRWNLTGVVFACEPMLLCPRLVGYVKNRGLVCATYGELNNVPENVRIQSEAGVDIIIADRVGLVAKTLAGEGVARGKG